MSKFQKKSDLTRVVGVESQRGLSDDVVNHYENVLTNYAHGYSVSHDVTSAPEDEQKYDLCLVLPCPNGELLPDAVDLMDRIIHAIGMKCYYQYYTSDRRYRIVLLRVSLSKLRIIAEKIQYKMLLDAKVIKEAAIVGDKANFIDSIRIPNDTIHTKHDPFDFIYAKFKNDESILDYYNKSSPELKHPFDRKVRLDILLHILQVLLHILHILLHYLLHILLHI